MLQPVSEYIHPFADFHLEPDSQILKGKKKKKKKIDINLIFFIKKNKKILFKIK